MKAMPKPVCSTYGKHILIIQLMLILNTKIKFIVAYCAILVFLQALCISVRIGIGNITINLTPEIAAINTYGNSLIRRPTNTEEHLMQTTCTRIGITVSCSCQSILTLHGTCIRIIISYVRDRQDSEGNTKIASCAESTHSIFKICISCILAYLTLLEVCQLKRKPSIEDKGKRIDCRIRSRIEIVYLVMRTKPQTDTIHASIETVTLI